MTTTRTMTKPNIIQFLCIIKFLLCGTGYTFSTTGPTRKTGNSFLSLSSTTTKLASKSFFVTDSNDDFVELSPLEKDRVNMQNTKYGHSDWVKHRSGDRFFQSLFMLQDSPIVKNLIDEVGILILISMGIIGWNELVIDGYTDWSGVTHVAPFANVVPNQFKLTLPTDPFFLCGGPLGLLLVFRTDAAFGRYNEGLHLWEKIISHFTSMLLMASNCSANKPAVEQIGLANWALARTLQHELSGDFDPKEKYEASIRNTLTNKVQAERLLTSRNKLYRAQYDIHQSIEAFNEEISELDSRSLINSVNDVGDCCVRCERLYTTPIPLLYTRHALKFLTFWMSLMPFALYNVFEASWNHFLMIPAIAILTFLFFGIEEIAASLEEPFSILPLEELVEESYLAIGDVSEWMDNAEDAKAAAAEEEKTTATAPFFKKL